MNNCVFCGTVALPPIKRLLTKENSAPLTIFRIQMWRRHKDDFVADYVDIFAFGILAEIVMNKLKKSMKVVAVCTLISKKSELPRYPDEPPNARPRFWNRPYFVLKKYFCTETPEKADVSEDFAEDHIDDVFSGELGKVMEKAAKAQQNRIDYSKPPKRYKDKVNYPKNDDYYSQMLDDIVKNADMGDIEK